MATLYWVGGDSGNENDFATAANWRDDSNDNVAGAAPASDDIVLFDHRAAANCTGSMSQGSVDLQGLRVTNGFRYNVGASGSPLVIAVSNATTATPFAAFAQSEGAFYWTAGTNNVDLLEIEGTSATGLFLTGGTFTSVYMQGGVVNQGADCTITTMRVGGGVFTSDAVGSGSAITTYRQAGGRASINRVTTTAHCGGGTTFFRANGTPTTFNQHTGSNVTYHGKSITNFNYYGGVFDPTGNGRNLTLGSSSGEIFYGSPGRLVEEAPGIEITVSATKFGKKSPGM